VRARFTVELLEGSRLACGCQKVGCGVLSCEFVEKPSGRAMIAA
jgi:hypothetical protein